MASGQAETKGRLNKEGRMVFSVVRLRTRPLIQIAIEYRKFQKVYQEGVKSKMTDTASTQQQILDTYYADNARRLHKTVDRILSRFGGLYGKDKDDFYSLANEVFVDVLKRYDSGQPFDGFLYACLSNKIMSEVTRRNREKRKADRMAVSLDAVNGDEEECSLLDFLPSDFDTFEEASKGQEDGQYSNKVQRYISGLSDRQVNILNLIVDGYDPGEIRRILEISPKEYSDSLNIMRSYEKVKVLF